MTIKSKIVHCPKVVAKMLGVSYSTYNRMLLKGLLKKPIRISARAVGHLDSEIQEFLNKRILERDNDSQ